MAGHCCEPHSVNANNPTFRKVLWFALVVNAAMFVVEIFASELSNSVSLKADALDFFGDAANYAISLFVIASSVAVRAKASLFKAATMLLFGAFVVYSATERALYGSEPVAHTMGVVGFLALVANVVVALTLYRYRSGDSNMQSVWLCSRNDAIGNLAVIAAAGGVFVTASRWPDLVVAAIIATLAVSSAWQVIKVAKAELASKPASVK